VSRIDASKVVVFPGRIFLIERNAGTASMRVIYKICTFEEWTGAQRNGKFVGSEVDRRDGFIHFSTREQVEETAARHFAQLRGLVLVMIDGDRLGPALKWEPSRGGALFPHLYAPLDASAAIWVKELPDGEGRRAFLAALSDR
jgi:uncharacterized protein (DUF952 family)